MSRCKWRWFVSGSTVARSTSSSPASEDRYAHAITAAYPLSCWVRSLQGIQAHTMVLLSSVSRGKGRLCWEVVFYDNHEAAAKQINLFHAFYPRCRQLQREALAVGKHALLTLLGSRVTSFKFFGTMAFFPQLPWLLFPLHWRHAAGWDLALFPRVPGESSP